VVRSPRRLTHAPKWCLPPARACPCLDGLPWFHAIIARTLFSAPARLLLLYYCTPVLYQAASQLCRARIAPTTSDRAQGRARPRFFLFYRSPSHETRPRCSSRRQWSLLEAFEKVLWLIIPTPFHLNLLWVTLLSLGLFFTNLFSSLWFAHLPDFRTSLCLAVGHIVLAHT